MPTLVYAVPCHDIIVDRQTSDTTFIRSIEHAAPPELPSQLPGFAIGTLWEPEGAESFSVALRFETPEGEETFLGTQEVSPGETVLHKMTFQLPGLEVKVPGRHVIKICILSDGDWKTLANLPLYIVQR